MKCTNCGTDLPEVANYCLNCGKPQRDDVQPYVEPEWEYGTITWEVTKDRASFENTRCAWRIIPKDRTDKRVLAQSKSFYGDVSGFDDFSTTRQEVIRESHKTFLDEIVRDGWEIVELDEADKRSWLFRELRRPKR